MSTKQKPIPEEHHTPHLKKLMAQANKKEQEQNALQLKINKALTKAKEARRAKFDRQKYALGGDLFRRADEGLEFQGVKFQDIMDYMIRELTRDQDRKAFDLEPFTKKESSPAKAMKKVAT